MIEVSAAATWLIAAALALGAFVFARRYGGGAALEQLERANKILTARVAELEAQDIIKTAEIAKLRLETNVSQSIIPVLNALRNHEVQAERRSRLTIGILQQIADSLPREAL